jgi:hypothetical protein
MPDAIITIPARRGKAAYVAAGQIIRVINTHGEQVIDTWAFNRHDMTEFMSMEHSRATMQRLIPRVGDALLTNHRRPILTVLDDTSGGIHDTLMAACDRYRYEGLGCTEYHDNCTDNLAQGLAELGLTPPETPSPLNLFMNIPRTAEGALSFEPPVSGDRILGLSAGHPANQRPRRKTDRGTFPHRILTMGFAVLYPSYVACRGARRVGRAPRNPSSYRTSIGTQPSRSM